MPITPNDNDVLFGRGVAIASHPGNERLRSMVRTQKPQFHRAKKKEKSIIARNIVGAIQSMGGRFLMEDPQNATPTGASLAEKVWVCADDERAVKKVMHRLRERNGVREEPAVSLGGGVPTIQQQRQQLPLGGNDVSIHTGSAAGTVPSSEISTSILRGMGMHPHSMGNLGYMSSIAGPQPVVPSANNAGALAALAQSLGLGNLGSAAGLTMPPSNNLASILGHVGVQQSMMGGMGSHSAAGQLSAGGHAQGVAGAAAMPPVDLMGMLNRARMQQPIIGQASSQGSMTVPVGNSYHDGGKAGALPLNNAPASILSSSMNAEQPAGKQTTDPHCQSATEETDMAAEGLAIRPTSDGWASSRESMSTFAEADNLVSSPNLLNSSFHSRNSELQGISSSADVRSGSPITVDKWIESASDLPTKTVYIIGSVELAWRIARQLRGLVRAEATLNPQDNASENLRIFVEHPLWSHDGSEAHSCRPSIQRVEFATSESGAPLQERHACASLGRILMKIFGMNQTSLDAPVKRERGDDGMPPAQKRRATGPGNDSVSTRASGILMALLMPSSINRLVCDLLDAANEKRPSRAIVSLEEALWDLGQMRKDPESFLFDLACPEKALDHFYSLGEDVFGREKELTALLEAKQNLSTFVQGDDGALDNQESSFLCEAAFVGGYAGSGKSTLLLPLIHACNEEQWFVISCKFDKQTEPVKVVCKMLDAFFGRWGDHDGDPSFTSSFRQVCECICSTIDDDGLCQLSELLPSFAKLYPMAKTGSQDEGGGISSMDKVGSAQNRLLKLINVLFESICSAGRPVLVTLDDLQWSGSFALEGLTDFVLSNMPGGIGHRRGVFVAGTYRSNEVQVEGSLMKSINAIKDSEHANVTMLTTGELSKCDVTELVSAKLCLPKRYTQPLANVVHSKTRGNPFFVIQFLRSIIANKMLQFSVESKRWIWDCDVVEMQMMPDGVAALLTSSFNRLPEGLMQAMKIVSCLGYQVERPTIDALDSTKEVLPFSILDELQLAVKEGILEKAGPMYQFTHDIIQQTVYELIPPGDRKILHKLIGQSLLKAARGRSTIHLLAVDQINMFCKDSALIPEEQSHFSRSNATAAKFAIADSSFERARSYIDMGMQLLEPNHWETQYHLSLELYEMSASVSCISGDISTMSTCLEAVLSHVMTFEDSLKASSMLAKLLASNSKYDDARSNCLDILRKLGEDFPSEVSLALVQKELPEILTFLRNITYDRIKALPAMTDRTKLNAMKFLNMLCMYCAVSKPLLLPFLTRRMVQLTLEHGFCEDSTVGIATSGFSVYLFTDDLQLAVRLGKVSELLVDESSKKHLLRARLCNELYTQLKLLQEHWPSVVTLYPELYSSAMFAGDIENALICRWTYAAVAYWSGALKIPTISEQSLLLMKEAAKYQQNRMLYNTMAIFQSCIHLSGRSSDEVEIKSLDEIIGIGEETNGTFLVWHAFMHKMSNLFWSREFMAAAELSEKYSEKHHSALQQKRVVHFIRVFYEGVVYLNLARGPGNTKKWRELGEKAVATITGYVTYMSKWNFENKSLLLQAELHYLNGNLELADTAYKASIKSAHHHKVIHEEALAYELHGRFCVENQMAERGSKQLRVAVSKYNEWGATKKAKDVQRYLDPVLACMSLSAL